MFRADYGNAGARWPVLRIGIGSRTEVTLLSREFFCLTTHYHRCTIPCAIDGCSLCEMLPSRGLFYLAVMCEGRRSILELGVFSANDLEQHTKLLHGGMMPGHLISLSRRTAKGPIRSTVLATLPEVGAIDRLMLAQRVLAIYKLPCANPSETIETYEERIRSMVLRRNEHLARELSRGSRAGV